jgi:hypothetical protein
MGGSRKALASAGAFSLRNVSIPLALSAANKASEDMANKSNPGGSNERDRTPRVGDGRHWSTIVILAMLAVVIIVGLIFSMRDYDTTASNKAPAVTTGTSTPSPSNPPRHRDQRVRARAIQHGKADVTPV